jgi:hypothetical protein
LIQNWWLESICKGAREGIGKREMILNILHAGIWSKLLMWSLLDFPHQKNLQWKI